MVQCSAKSKQSGKQCKRFAMRDKHVCYMHGGKSTGIRTVEGKLKQRKAITKHGLYTNKAIEERKNFRKFIRECREDLCIFESSPV